jgi:hypothetical protein
LRGGRVAAAAHQDEARTNGDWQAALARWGLPAPDREPLNLNGTTVPLAWRTRLAAASFAALDEQASAAVEAMGYAVAIIPQAPGDAPPPQLVDLLGQSA